MTAAISTPPRNDLDASSDAALLERFTRLGDEAAFQSLVRRHGPMVLGVCRRVLGNHHDAEDAFQVTFLLLARKAATLGRPELLAGWLYGVAYRTARKLRGEKARRHEAEQLADLPDVTAQGPPLELAWREVQDALDEEIARLDVKYRAPLVLCYIEGKTQEQVARQLGRPTGSMSWLLGRALADLRARLARRGMTLLGGMPALLLAINPSVPLDPRLVGVTVQAVFLGKVAGPVIRLLEQLLSEHPVQAASRLATTLTVSVVAVVLISVIGLQGLFARSPGHAPVTGSCGGGAVVAEERRPAEQAAAQAEAPELAQMAAPPAGGCKGSQR